MLKKLIHFTILLMIILLTEVYAQDIRPFNDTYTYAGLELTEYQGIPYYKIVPRPIGPQTQFSFSDIITWHRETISNIPIGFEALIDSDNPQFPDLTFDELTGYQCESQFIGALSRWQQATISRFGYTRFTENPPYTLVDVQWKTGDNIFPDTRYGGITYLCVDNSDPAHIQLYSANNRTLWNKCSIYFNGRLDRNWYWTGNPNKYQSGYVYFYNAALHELGHFMGLGDEADDAESIMYPRLGDNRGERDLDIHDQDAVDWLFMNMVTPTNEPPQPPTGLTAETVKNFV